MGTKNTYNNYQFYETPALTKYLEEQSIKGYSFCGAVGEFLDILKFRYDENKAPQSYCVLRKRLDKNIDEKIQIMKTNSQMIYENNVYVVFSNQTDNEFKNLEQILKKQDALQVVTREADAFWQLLVQAGCRIQEIEVNNRSLLDTIFEETQKGDD